MKIRLKSIITAAFALAASFIIGSALAVDAPTPVAVWNGDFSELTKGGITLDLNGNTSVDTTAIKITTDYGVKLTGFSTKTPTILVGYKNLSTSDTSADKRCLISLGSADNDNNADLVGATVIPSSKEITGVFQSGWWESSSNRRAKKTYPWDTTVDTEHFFAYAQDHSGNTGAYFYLNDGDGQYTLYWGNSGLKSSNAALDRAAIGGPARHGARYSSNGIVACSGMVITRIAVFNSVLGVADLAAFDFDFPTRMYSNTLATDGATVPAGTYGDIVVPDYGYKATSYDTQTVIGDANSALKGTQGGSWRVATHTISGWFKVTELPAAGTAEASSKPIFVSISFAGASGGYKLGVTPDGYLNFGRINGNSNVYDSYVTTDGKIGAGEWHYLTVAVDAPGTNGNPTTPTIFVDGVRANITSSGTSFVGGLNGGSFKHFDICAGISAAGLYADTTAVTDVATIKKWATNKSLVEAAPLMAKVTLTEAKDWSAIDWGAIVPSAEVPAEITFAGGSLNINQNVDCAAINFKGAAIVSAGEFTFPAIGASSATSLTVNGGTIEFTSIPSSNITIAKDATLKMNVSTATTVNGISGAGKFLKTGNETLTLNNGATYALDGTTLEIAQGNVKMNAGNNGDPQAQNATFVIGANGSLDQNGWFNVYGTITFDLAADKTVFNSTIRTYDGTRKLIKKGAGTLTFGAGPNGSGFGEIVIEKGAVAFAGKEGFIKSDATFDLAQHDKTTAAIAGAFTFSEDYTFKFPSDWAVGETFPLCSGTLSGIPEGGKIADYQFYLGDTQVTHTFNLLSNGFVFYNTGVKPIAPEGDYAISTLNGEEIGEGQTVELTIAAGKTLTIDAVANATTAVICDGILIIEGANGAEPTAEQLAALNFEGVTGKIVKKWLARMGVININLNSGNGKFPDDDTSDDGMLAGNTPKSSWINTTGATGTLTDITEWKTLTQESAAVTGMTFEWDANTTWSANATIPIRGGYLDDGKDNGVTLTLAGVPYEMYDVIVYFSTDQGGGLYQPMTVNGIAYTGDKTTKATLLGNAAWGDNAVVTSVDEGINALRVRDLAGNVTIHTAKRANSTRGCVAAIQIVQVPTKEYRRTYTAKAGENVTTSFLNSYIAEGDTYTGPFTLTLNGGKYIADADFVCAALAINSEADLTIEKAASYEIPATEVAKIAINEFSGNKITYVNLPMIPATAPAEGKTYRWEGTESLATLPFAGVTVAGTLEIACPITSADAFAVANSHNSYVFDAGFSLTAQQLIIGNVDSSVQHFTQNGGTITLTKEYTGTDTTTAMPFLLAHWSSTCTYDLVGGSIIVENGNVMFGRDGTIAMTVGGGETTATFKARGISRDNRNGTCPLTIAENGILQLGVGGIDFLNGDQKKVILAGGKIEIYDNATIATTAATEVTKNSTIDIAAEKTLTLNTTFTGAGTITFTGTGTLNLGKSRDLSKFSIGDGITVQIAEDVAEDGEATFTGTAPETVKLVRVDGTTETLTVTEGKASYIPSVKGTACWMDYEFEGNLNNAGTDTTGLARDGKDFGEDAANDFRNGSELYTGTHPYRGISYPTEWTCAIYGSIPEYGEAALITFGTRGVGLIGLIKGPNATDDMVYLVRTTGDKKYEILAEMSVPNATTAQHLYAFVKTDKNIEIYLDGKHWKSYSSDTSITFGGGLQIASVHGGVGSTGIVRFDKALFDGDNTNETLRKSVIGMMRLYNCVLGPKAMKVLADEFQYVSPNGLFKRTLADSENGAWNETDKWTKVLESGTEPATVPDDKAMVRVATSDEAATLAINLDAEVTTEAIELSGTGALTIELAENKTAGVVNSGSTTVALPLTIKYGALSISGGPTAIEEGGSIKFDYSAAPEEFFQVGYIPLTGDIAEQGEDVVTAVLPQPTKSYLAYSFGYNSTDSSYGITVAYNRTATTLYLTEDATLADNTPFALTEGGEATAARLFEDDVIVVPAEKTLTIPGTGLAIPAKAVIGAGTIVCDGYLPTTITTLQTTDWTGTLYLKNIGWNNFDFGAYGSADSKIKLTGVTGFGPKQLDAGAAPTIILEDGADEEGNTINALTITDGFSRDTAMYTFYKVTGSGTFSGNDIAITQTYVFQDLSGFTGKIENIGGLKIVIGNGVAGDIASYVSGAINFVDGTTVSAAFGWNAGKAAFGDTLIVKDGAVGDVFMTGLTAAPTSVPAVTLDGEEGTYTLKYAEGSLTIAYADVSFTVPAITGATPFIEGYDIGEDGSVAVPYGASVTLVYTADSGKLFNGGSTTVNVSLENITDASAVASTIAAAIEGKSTADAEAQIWGGASYLTLAEAFAAAADKGFITLLKDVELTDWIVVDKEVSLNLGAFSITQSADWAPAETSHDHLFCVTYGGNLQIMATSSDSAIDATGGNLYGAIKMTNKGDVRVGDEIASLAVVGGQIIGNYAAISGNGGRPGTEIAIDASFEGVDTLIKAVVENDSVGIFNPQDGTVTITGGTIEGAMGIIMKSGSLLMTDGKVVANGEYAEWVKSNNGFNNTGDAIEIDNIGYPGEVATVSISNDAIVESANGAAVASRADGAYTPITGFIAGGKFKGAIDTDTSLIATLETGIGKWTTDADGYKVPAEDPAMAKIGTKLYLTLAEAVTAATDNDEVTLLASCAGDGIKIDKSITIDFGGFTYTVDASLVGSPSTQSQAFNLVRGNTITLKNGTITSTVARMLVQNYASLTLEDMILDGTNLAAKNGKGNDYVAYTLSNCAGDTVITGDSVIKARVLDGQTSFAFDTYYQAGKYEDATVTVNGATIDGDVELAGGSLTLTAGTLNGALVEGSNIEKGVVTKDDAFEAAAPAGYEWKDGKLTAIYPEAEVKAVTPPEELDFAFEYKAKNDAPLYNASVASFILTANKAIPAGAIQIGGKFVNMGWNIYDLPSDITEGGSFTVVENIPWSQVKAVSPFTCGAKSIALTEDTEVTLTLKLDDKVIDTQTITLKAKAIEPVDPEEPKSYDTEKEAQDAADKMNGEDGKIKPEYINAPANIDKTAYAKLFEAVAEGNTVTVKLTTAAETAIKEDLAKPEGEATILEPVEGKATIAAKPGLFYGIAAEDSLGKMSTAKGQNWVMATGDTVEVEVPTVAGNTAFFRPICVVKDPTK